MAGINFTVGVDGSQYFSGMKNMENVGKSTSKAIQDAFGQKLKQVLSFTAIEEGIRRTAEWASEMSQVSRALGITTDALQVMNKVASKTGTPTEAIKGMFENINKARDEALRGNQQLIVSFNKLGITFDDLKNKNKEQLFGQVLQGVKPGTNDQFLRTATQEITGTPENVIGGFVRGMESTEGKPDWNKTKEGEDIIPAEDLGTLSSLWDQIKTSLIEMMGDFVPFINVCMVFIKLLVDAFGMITGLFKDTFNIIIGILTGDWGKIKDAFHNIGGLIINIGIGFLKSIAEIIDWATGLIAKIWKGKGTKYAKEIEEGAAAWNKEQGYSEKTARRGQAGGELLPMFMSAGSTGIAKTGAIAMKSVGGVAETLGAGGIAKLAGKYGGKMEKFVATNPERLQKIASVNRELNKDIAFQVDKKIWMDSMEKQGLQMPEKMGGRFRRKNAKGEFEELSESESAALQRDYDKRFGAVEKRMMKKFGPSLMKEGVSAGIFAAFTAKTGVQNLKDTQSNLYQPGTEKPIMPFRGFGVEKGGGGTDMLKFGGVFGAGDTRIVQLNTQMVSLLSKIQENTGLIGKQGGIYANSVGRDGAFAGGF